jgi:hypothetical protein
MVTAPFARAGSNGWRRLLHQRRTIVPVVAHRPQIPFRRASTSISQSRQVAPLGGPDGPLAPSSNQCPLPAGSVAITGTISILALSPKKKRSAISATCDDSFISTTKRPARSPLLELRPRAAPSGDREFESISLQRGVSCEPDFPTFSPREDREGSNQPFGGRDPNGRFGTARRLREGRAIRSASVGQSTSWL